MALGKGLCHQQREDERCIGAYLKEKFDFFVDVKEGAYFVLL